ncbi:MAG: response regulator [Sediminibacterium sp.]|nr:response regulator [Sediminibacterium sp.]
MQLKCIAIDDEPLALELIKQYIERVPELQLVQTFDDAITGGEFLRANTIDLLFIDINMPDITGIELVRSLKDKPATIFTTAYKKFAFEGFELEAVDYLLKPISFERFLKAARRVIDFHAVKYPAKAATDEHFFVRSEYRMVKIEMNEIDYIEGLEDYIKIHLTNVKPVLTLMTLKAVLEKLPEEKFQRIHRSYIVPVNKVQSILNRKLTLANGAELPVSDSYVAFINEWMKKGR